MSIAIMNRVKALEERVAELERKQSQPVAGSYEEPEGFFRRKPGRPKKAVEVPAPRG